MTSPSKISLVAKQEQTGHISGTVILSKKHCLMERRQLTEPHKDKLSGKMSEFLGDAMTVIEK